MFGLKKSNNFKHYYELDQEAINPIFKINNFKKEELNKFNAKLDNEIISFSWFKDNYKNQILKEFTNAKFDDEKRVFSSSFHEKTDLSKVTYKTFQVSPLHTCTYPKYDCD